MNEELQKKLVGHRAAELIENGMIVGLGTGSTVFYFIEKLIEKVQSGLKIKAVSSSNRSLAQASSGGISVIDINTISKIDITVDGADEIDSQKRMIKGGGGALLREKILASMSSEMIVVIDDSKLSEQLGKKKLPVEIVPFAHMVTLGKLKKLGFQCELRKESQGTIYTTDNGNFIVDIFYPNLITHPENDHDLIKTIPGVVETGFFFHLAGRVIIGFQDGQVVIKP
ncbi:MAG: ribose 5-phosphate isomerase A [Chlamydiae bacterium]|nr:ribose 5-phosphate isomerase A [Chlamydiota bacterium]